RLEKLVHQQKQVAQAPSRPRTTVPEFGIEEVGQDTFETEPTPEATESEGPTPLGEPLENVAAPADTPEAPPEPMETIAADPVLQASAEIVATELGVGEAEVSTPEEPLAVMPEPALEATAEAAPVEAVAATEVPAEPIAAVVEPTEEAPTTPTGEEP